MSDLLLEGETKIKMHEAQQSQFSAAPALSPPATCGLPVLAVSIQAMVY